VTDDVPDGDNTLRNNVKWRLAATAYQIPEQYHRSKKERMNRIDQELFEAAAEKDLPEIRWLLRAGADVNAKDNDDWTPLHWACYQGHVQVVIELLGHAADSDAQDRSGWTPLHFACCNGQMAVVIELLSGGANILAANNEGRLPVHCAVTLGFSKVAKYLLQHIYATTRRLPLHELVEDLTWIGDPTINDAPPLREALDDNVMGTDDVVEILEYVVNQNPDSLASCDQDGSLPLHFACHRGASFTIVQFLVNHFKAFGESL
jgi:ankyrin repeat protein